ncbi:MAG: hypothetical protein SWX82_07680 [Cyanobacteriota bacterium]|nr:hypothetical protein [Cyanobacteriota bacterium]
MQSLIKRLIISLLVIMIGFSYAPVAFAQVTVSKGDPLRNSGAVNSKLVKETMGLVEGLKYADLWKSSNTTIAKSTNVRIDVQNKAGTRQNLQAQTNVKPSKSIAGVLIEDTLSNGQATPNQQQAVLNGVTEGFNRSLQDAKNGQAYFYIVGGSLPQ